MTEATIKPTKLQTLITKHAAAVAAAAKLNAEIDELNVAAEAEAVAGAARRVVDVSGLEVGTAVVFVYGRKDTRKERAGVVKAFAAAVGDMPARYKIEVGDGFEAELLTVPARDVATPVIATEEQAA